MKKIVSIICLLCIVALLVALPYMAYAEAATTDTTAPAITETTQTEPFTWSYLVTIGGASILTLLIVQFFKLPLDRIWKIPTRVFVYLIALIILLVATAFTSGLTIDSAALAVVNAILVAVAAMGSYEVTFAKHTN